MINKKTGRVLTADDILALQAAKAQAAAEKAESALLKAAEKEAERKEKEMQREAQRQAEAEAKAKADAEAKAKAKEQAEADAKAQAEARRLEKEAARRQRETPASDEDAERAMAGIRKTKRKSNSPFASDSVTATREEMANTVKNKMKWFVLGKQLGKPKDDDEVFQRITQFWDMVRDSGEVPHKQDLFLFMNISEQTYWGWKNGQSCSRERAEMIQAAEYLLSSVIDDTALQGNIQQIPYIWQTKQWFGYKEPKAELEVTSHNPMQAFPDAMAVEQKYQDLITGDTEVDPKYLANVEVGGNEE